MGKATGTVTQQFENLPIDEGLRKISSNFIIVLKKTGQQGKSLQVKKVIIIAQKDTHRADSKTQTRVSSPPPRQPLTPPGARVIARSSSKSKSNQKAPHPQRVNLQRKTKRKPPKRNPQKVALKKPPVDKSRQGKKVSRTASLSPLNSSGQGCGELYFKQKRWDKAITCLKKSLKQNPSNQQIKEKLETARQNAERAISLYQQGRKLEDSQNFSGAYEQYKKSCAIYPLLYDAWERMKALQRKLEK